MTADGRRGLFGVFTVHSRHWTHRRCDGEDDTTVLVVRLEAFPQHKLDRGIFLLLLHSSLNMKLEGWLVAWCLCGGGVVVRPLACAGRHGRRRCELARVPTHLFTIH